MGNIFLIIGGLLLILVGFVGCIVPVLPGPPIAYLGLLLLQFTSEPHFSSTLLIILGVITLIITVLDYVIPVWGTKKFGGTKGGTWGSIIGIILGIFILPPIGILIFPFLGAYVGELINGVPSKKALTAALGSFLGFLSGTFMKFLLCLVMLVIFIIALF